VISYAGVTLVEPDAGTLARAEAALAWGTLGDFESPDRSGPGMTYWQTHGRPRDLPPRSQTLRWPRGAARWAVGRFLATDNELARIRQYVHGGSAYRAAPLVLTDERGHTTTTSLFLLPARPAFQIAGDRQLWALTLVDDRYWWWERRGTVAVTLPRYNELGHVLVAGTTWASLFAQIGALLGTTLAVSPSVSASYGYPPVVLAGLRHPLPLVLDAAAAMVGRRVVRALDGTVTLQAYAAAAVQQAATLAAYRKVGGGTLAVTQG
jgi:hypothetical protein